MGWPQITVIVLYALAVGISLAQHGKVKEEPENAWSTIITAAVMMVLLYAGGFFGG